ncbi:MAG TPA: ABC transporter permease [Solirubrobacterales bacterium]|nr:ABC transporter permease [Solirubrobacterales bacterium]
MPPLLKLILIRLGLGLLTLFLVSLVVFAATQALPGDPAQAILGKEAADKARYEALRKQLNLDRPMLAQYSSWLGGVVRGDMGTSIVQQDVPVTDLLRERIINSATLVAIAALLSIPLSIVIGAFSAVWRDSKFDSTVNLTNLALAALPEFVIGIALVLLFATAVFKWLPAVSRIDPDLAVSSQLTLFVLPAVTLCLAVIPYVSRMLRASAIEVLESEYVMMARLKGLSGRVVLWRHTLPNAIVPTLQVIAINLAWLAGGIVTVEYLFGFPGIGQSLVDAVANRDIPLVQALVLLIAAVYVVLNLTADVLTILINPRLRTGLR